MRRILALYEDLPDAEPVVRDLMAAGIPRGDVTVTANTDEHWAFYRNRTGSQSDGMPTAEGPASRADRSDEGFLSWLFGGGTPAPDATAYHRGVESGGKLVCVDAPDDLHDRALDILEQHGAVDIDERGRGDEAGAAVAGTVEGSVAGGTAATPSPTTASTQPDIGPDGIATSDGASGGIAGSSGSFGAAAPDRDRTGYPAAGADPGRRRVRSYPMDAHHAAAPPDLAAAGSKPGGAVAGLAPEEIDGGVGRYNGG